MTTAAPSTASSDKRSRYHHGDLRAHLISTVRQLVEEKGVEGFSILQASRLAGVSSAAPYKHFADKHEIVRAVALDGIERLGRAMAEGAASASAANFGKVNAIGHAYVRFAREEPGVFRLIFGLTEGHDKDQAMVACGHDAFSTLLREVAACLPEGASEQEVRQRTYMLWTFVHGHAFLVIDGKVDAANIGVDEPTMLSEISRRMLG